MTLLAIPRNIPKHYKATPAPKRLDSTCVLMTSIVAAILVALLVGPGTVNAAQCTANGCCFRGQFIVQFNYGSLAYIKYKQHPYVPYQVSDMLINTERETPDQQFIQVGYTVGGCGHPTPEIIGEFYAGGTQYDTRCFGSAAGGYNAYYMQRNPDGGWCIGYNQSPGLFCKNYPDETPISAGSAVTAYGEVSDTTVVMGGNSTTNSPTGYVASIYYNSNTLSNFIPITDLGGQYATCGASPCPYAETAYFQGGLVNVAVAGP